VLTAARKYLLKKSVNLANKDQIMQFDCMKRTQKLTFNFRNIPTTDQPSWQQRATGFIVALLSLTALPAHADYNADISYTILESELGAGIPDGSGVSVGQIEADVQVDGNPAWMPNPGNGEFGGKTITDISGAIPGIYSNHATNVGKRFYGTVTSTSPGIAQISSYRANSWLGNDFLRINTGSWPVYQPLSSANRVINHSWVGSAESYNAQGLARLDWSIEVDEMIQAVGFTGGTSPLLSSAYNVISVNRTAAPTDSGSANAGGVYTSGRTKPDIVAPASSASNATPRIASAAALLVDAAHNNPSWSTDPAEYSTTNRNGDTIYNAERVEIIKAALMTGADRETFNSTSTDITDYRVDEADQTVNGLDRRFGAGQLNIYNSYHIVAAGEQNSIEDYAGGAGAIGWKGFDYDPAFGGSQGSNAAATYYFTTTTGPARLTVSLAWNLEIDGGSKNQFDASATLYDLDLQLFDVTDSGNWVLVGSSTSTTENTENLWQLLDSGKNYALKVTPGTGQAAFKWDYGLAWQVTPVATITPLELNIDWAPPAAIQNQFYWWGGLSASGGQPPYTYSLVGGWIPWPMTLNSQTGVISGTPINEETAYFTVQVMDANSDTATVQSQITVTKSGYDCGASCHGAPGF